MWPASSNARGLLEALPMVPNVVEPGLHVAFGFEKSVWLRVLKAFASKTNAISLQMGMLRRIPVSIFHCGGLRSARAPVRGVLPMRLSAATGVVVPVWKVLALMLTGFWKAAKLKYCTLPRFAAVRPLGPLP